MHLGRYRSWSAIQKRVHAKHLSYGKGVSLNRGGGLHCLWMLRGRYRSWSICQNGGNPCAFSWHRNFAAQGAEAVYACATHAVLSGPAIERIAASGLKELVVTNTIPLTPAAQELSKIKVRSVAGLLGRTIESIHMETSVSTLFN